MFFLKRRVLASISFLVFLNFIFAFVDNAYDLKWSHSNKEQKIKGITVVAPPKPIGSEAFREIKDIRADWVAFVPYGYTRKGNTEVRYNLERQWWGEKPVGVEECIKEAKCQSLHIMLKPQVYIGDGWVGDMDFESEAEWIKWEESYRNYIMDFLNIAIKHDVEMFCIGTEYNIAVVKREKFWKKLIKDIRSIYKGKLIYSSNWDSYDQIKFWGDLDYIGISSYFPLSENKNPSLSVLNTEWRPIIKKLKYFSASKKRKIIFTEYGYMSVDGCAGKAWEIEKNLKNLDINHNAQCNSYEALWSNMSKEDFWAGGFLWKWFPDGMGHEGYPEKDYTPQNKPAELIIKKWFTAKI